MKLFAFGLASVGLAAAVAVDQVVDYSDWQVHRVNVAGANTEFAKLVKDIGLEVLKGKVDHSDVVDVMVSPSQLESFGKVTDAFETKVMHENLGESISAEAEYPVYAGIYPQTKNHINMALIAFQRRQLAMCQFKQLLQTLLGSTPITQLPTICSGSRILRPRFPTMLKRL
jgi:hypothetical protein